MECILRENKDYESKFHQLILDLFTNSEQNLKKIKDPLLNFSTQYSKLTLSKLNEKCLEL